jgi:hypothetical protein
MDDIEYNQNIKRERRRRRKEQIRSFVKEYMQQHVCKMCGTKNNLTFHHRDPSKKRGDISKLVSYKSLSLIQNEISKCDILCRHCHDIKHEMKGYHEQD